MHKVVQYGTNAQGAGLDSQQCITLIAVLITHSNLHTNMVPYKIYIHFWQIAARSLVRDEKGVRTDGGCASVWFVNLYSQPLEGNATPPTVSHAGEGRRMCVQRVLVQVVPESNSTT